MNLSCRTLFLLGLACVCSISCSRFQGGGEPAEPGFQLELRNAVFQPGEAVVADLSYHEADAMFPGLNNESLEFWLVKSPGDAQRVWPVTPDSEEGYSNRTTRAFVFTEATRSAGAYELMAGIRHPTPIRAEAMPVVWSNVSTFKVEGNRLFERDHEGMITREEAEKLAREHLLLDTEARSSTQLVSVIDGLKTWQVVFQFGTAGQVVWVNPYLGAVHTVQPGHTTR